MANHIDLHKAVWNIPILLFLFIGSAAFAQKPSHPGIFHRDPGPRTHPSVSEEKDVTDLVRGILKKSPSPAAGKRFNVSGVPAAGYAMHTGWAGLLTGNVAFHTAADSASEHRLSSIAMNITYTEFRQVMLPLQANIWSANDKVNYQIDYRYIHYPSKVFGLEDDAGIPEGYFVKFGGIKLHQTVMCSVVDNLYLGLGYYFDRLWDIRDVDPPAGFKTAFQQYGISDKVNAAGPVLKCIYDSRLNAINPENGLLASVAYRNNLTWMGSSNAWESLQLDVRKYVRFPAGSRNTLALWSFNWFTLSGKPPFLMLPSTGWDDGYNTGRGYIQGRFRGRNMVYLESEYRFRITGNGLIGGTVYGNIQAFSPEKFRSYVGLKPGYGMGLRIRLNKVSGANVCIDYGFGREGSRGFAVNLGEIF